MLSSTILTNIFTLILAGFPTSLLLTNVINKVTGPNDPKLAETTVICTDLSGTLTKNSLKVASLTFHPHKITIDPDKTNLFLSNKDTKQKEEIEKENLKQFESIQLAAKITSLVKYKKHVYIEKIIDKFFLEAGLNSNKFQSEFEIIQKIPTNKKKKITTIIAQNKQSGEIFSFTKGNPYNVLQNCKRTFLEGKKLDLDYSMRSKIKRQFKKRNKEGHKLIGFGFKPLPRKRLDHYTENFAETDLIFLGTIGLANPINESLKESVQLAKSLNIKTYITTSTRERTALAAGLQLGLVNPKYHEVISSSDLEIIKDHKLEELLKNKEKDIVFADMKDKDKERVYGKLKSLGEKLALAHRKSGSGLKTVIEKIKKERENKFNRKKCVYHAAICKITETALVLLAITLKAPLPFTITTILLLDVVINLILELALKHATFEKSLKPIYVISKSIFLSITIGIFYFFVLMKFGWHPAISVKTSPEVAQKISTILFATFGFIQILIALNLEKTSKSIFRKGILKNYLLILSSLISALFIYLTISTTELIPIIPLATLANIDWQIIGFMILILLLTTEIWKKFRTKNTCE